MAYIEQSFRAFKQAGWEDERVAARYHERLVSVTTQSIDAVLDAAAARHRSCVLDVATGAGYMTPSILTTDTEFQINTWRRKDG